MTDKSLPATHSQAVCKTCGRVCPNEELIERHDDGGVYHRPCPACNSQVLVHHRDAHGNDFVVPEREVLFQSVESILKKLYASQVS